MKISEFKSKRVTVMGLGLHGGGVGVVKLLYKAKARVIVTDLRKKEELQPSLEKLDNCAVLYTLGRHRKEDFINTDLIIKNPAVPEDSEYLQIARDNNIPIDTDIGIFFKTCPAPIIGVTGTKGKSTVASLIAKLLKAKYKQVVLAGNIGESVLDKLHLITKESLVVLELSSWQLAGLKSCKISPWVAVVTNIMPDHMNRYREMKDYIADKKQIYLYQKENDYLILNADNELCWQLAKDAKSKVLFYAQKFLDRIPGKHIGAFVQKDKLLFGSDFFEVADLADIKLLGSHNIDNVLAAVCVARLHHVEKSKITSALNNFKGIQNRLQLIGEIKGVKYIDDTTATIPQACRAALEALPAKKIILIAGGSDKNLSYQVLGSVIAEHVKTLILLPGTATAKLEKAARDANAKLKIEKADNMSMAVNLASSKAKSGDYVLLSPACASFGLFQHEFDRGAQFVSAVNLLK